MMHVASTGIGLGVEGKNYAGKEAEEEVSISQLMMWVKCRGLCFPVHGSLVPVFYSQYSFEKGYSETEEEKTVNFAAHLIQSAWRKHVHAEVSKVGKCLKELEADLYSIQAHYNGETQIKSDELRSRFSQRTLGDIISDKSSLSSPSRDRTNRGNKKITVNKSATTNTIATDRVAVTIKHTTDLISSLKSERDRLRAYLERAAFSPYVAAPATAAAAANPLRAEYTRLQHKSSSPRGKSKKADMSSMNKHKRGRSKEKADQLAERYYGSVSPSSPHRKKQQPRRPVRYTIQ